MSSRPGYTLEALVAWCYDITVEGSPDPNASLCIAEALGTANGRRPVLTEEQFAPIIAYFEKHREAAEYRLDNFDDDNQSWRDFASGSFDDVFTDESDTWMKEYLKGIQDAECPPAPDRTEEKLHEGKTVMGRKKIRAIVLDGGEAVPADEAAACFVELDRWDRESILNAIEEDGLIYDGLDSENANGDGTLRETFGLLGNVATIERNTDGEIYVLVRMPDESCPHEGEKNV